MSEVPIEGWAEIAAHLGLGVRWAKREATRVEDPLPVKVLFGRVIAWRTALDQWRERHTLPLHVSEPPVRYRKVKFPAPPAGSKRLNLRDLFDPPGFGPCKAEDEDERLAQQRAAAAPPRFDLREQDKGETLVPAVLKGPIPRGAAPPLRMPEGGAEVRGWIAIAKTVGTSVNGAKRAASRRRDPMPVYAAGRQGKAVTTVALLREWLARQGIATEGFPTDPFGERTPHFAGGKSLIGPGVYGVRAEGAERLKIGWTDTIPRRLAALECGCPFPLQLVYWIRGPRKLESELHSKLRAHRVHLEWFNDVPEVRLALVEAAKLHGGAWIP